MNQKQKLPPIFIAQMSEPLQTNPSTSSSQTPNPNPLAVSQPNESPHVARCLTESRPYNEIVYTQGFAGIPPKEPLRTVQHHAKSPIYDQLADSQCLSASRTSKGSVDAQSSAAIIPEEDLATKHPREEGGKIANRVYSPISEHLQTNDQTPQCQSLTVKRPSESLDVAQYHAANRPTSSLVNAQKYSASPYKNLLDAAQQCATIQPLADITIFLARRHKEGLIDAQLKVASIQEELLAAQCRHEEEEMIASSAHKWQLTSVNGKSDVCLILHLQTRPTCPKF